MNNLAQTPNPEPTKDRITVLSSDSDWREAAIVLRVLRPDLETEAFASRREQLISEGYCLLGLRVGEQLVSVASYTISPHVMLGRELLIHDLATLPEMSGRGYASALLSELVKIAAAQKCGRIFVHTRHAQSLYLQNNFEEYSTGMMKRLERE